MKLESIKLKNFRTFKDASLDNIPGFCVLVGANGTGKSTVFSVFDFLKTAMSSDVNVALEQLGGPKGFDEVRSRGCEGPIEIEIKFRTKAKAPLATYLLRINSNGGRAFVEREVLKYRRGSKGQPWRFLDFSNGSGTAVNNEIEDLKQFPKDFTEQDLNRQAQQLRANDLLAVKGLAQFKNFPVVRSLGEMIEDWHVSDFHIERARQTQTVGNRAEHLSKEGENLSLVLQYLYKNHRETFDKILSDLRKRIPGISNVDSTTTEDGRVLLRFRDGKFEDPFLARFVSDGTIKMLTYLVLLNDPLPHPLLCVEEPENQLYHSLLAELAEEFRLYAGRGARVMVSTHSPDFLNAVELSEVFMLVKKDGYTTIRRASNDPQIAAYMNNGDKMGWLWRQGFFEGVTP